MTVGQINRGAVLAAVRAGARSREDLAERFGVLSTSATLRDVLTDLLVSGLLVEDIGGFRAHGEQLTLDEEIR